MGTAKALTRSHDEVQTTGTRIDTEFKMST